MDYLKTTDGSSLPMNTLIDMASQARHLYFFLLLLCLYSFHNIYQIPFHFLFHFLFSCRDPHRKQWLLLWQGLYSTLVLSCNIGRAGWVWVHAMRHVLCIHQGAGSAKAAIIRTWVTKPETECMLAIFRLISLTLSCRDCVVISSCCNYDIFQPDMTNWVR